MRLFLLLNLTVSITCATESRALTAAPTAPSSCPPPLEFADRKAELMEGLRTTRDADAGRFLGEGLTALWQTAPDRRAQALLDAGIRMRGENDDHGAIAAFDALIAYCPAYAEGWHQRALARQATGDTDGALSDLQMTLDEAPDHIGALAAEWRLLTGLGRIEAAAPLAVKLRQLAPWLPPLDAQSRRPGRDT